MKSIEEMIDEEPELPGDMPDEMFNTIKGDKDAITQTLRIAVRQTKNNIKRKILSRFAEKDKRIAELEKLPQIKYIYGLITKIAELEKQVADLRCCGNCVHYAYDMEEDHHYCDKHIYSGLRHQGICTNNWQSDNKTKAEREK